MSWRTTAGRAGVAVAAVPAVLWAAAGSPLSVLDDVLTALAAPAGSDPFAAVVPVAALLAWALAAWWVATVALVLAAPAPGAVGRVVDRAARRLAPAAVRRAAHLALGVGLAAGVTCAGPASAAPPVEAPAVSAPSLDWPTGPRRAPPPAPPSTVPATGPADGTVVVAPGDTLWSLAARSLGPGASPPQVAAAWPAWWAANRDVVGADPDLIHPGQRLTPPAPAS